ncbi:MAG: prepilin-type N-terminal cleavage/methylation domain-containing protein [Phycisphaerales bacterium]|nr:prepilin-type N-terminal cleavage/methylation domain-containing protein [Phycisphaerales bacterium]
MIRSRITDRAFTLIEVVIAVLILAIAVPPTLGLLDATAAGRADTVNSTRATILASSVLESVLADIASTDESLGFSALEDAAAYLDTPTAGLYARLSGSLGTYEKYGFTYSVEIGELVGVDGTVSASPSENLFRVITVRVGYPSGTGDDFELPVSLMVGAL